MLRFFRFFRRLILWLLAIVIVGPILLVAVFRHVPVPITPLMVVRVVEGDGLARRWTPLSRVSAYVPEAVIAAEDNLFCQHSGFDWDALSIEVDRAMAGDRPRGASTISNQVAKNLFLWPGRDLARKVLEAYLTLIIEALWDKRRIMEVYLNIAEWGRGVFGVAAAAKIHFRTTPARLSRRQAATLAAVLPNPREWNAGAPGDYVTRRAIVLMARMNHLGTMLDCIRTK